MNKTTNITKKQQQSNKAKQIEQKIKTSKH